MDNRNLLMEEPVRTDEIVQLIGERTHLGFFMCHLRSLRLLYINDKFASLFEISKEQLLEKPGLLLKLLRTEEITHLQNVHSELMTTGSVSNAEFCLCYSSGRVKRLSCDAFTIDEDTAIGFVKDITIAKEYEDRLIAHAAETDLLLEKTAHQLSDIFHLDPDLNPVLEEVNKGAQDNKTGQLFGAIQNVLRQYSQHTRYFLKKKHMSSGNSAVVKSRFDLLQQLNKWLEELSRIHHQKKFSLITNLPSLIISTDSVKLFQVLHSLLANAVKYTPQHGGEVCVGVEEYPQSVVISIRDNGPGIPEHLQADIFSNYFGSSASDDQDKGLQIVRTLTERLGGSVGFISETNKGTTFQLELPKE